MILELDCGNSFIKWRVLSAPESRVVDSGGVETAAQLFDQLRAGDIHGLSFCRLVSVRAEAETQALQEGLAALFPVPVVTATARRRLHGVSNGYLDPERLGADRWLALVAAYRLAGRACLVFSLGTTVTCDLVSAQGQHLGGYIAPGMPLMRHELRTQTGRVRYDAASARRALGALGPGKNTAQGVERGSLLMIRGFVILQAELAKEHLGGDFAVYLTGGDAMLVAQVVPRAHVVPDLVLQGLALACPVPEPG